MLCNASERFGVSFFSSLLPTEVTCAAYCPMLPRCVVWLQAQSADEFRRKQAAAAAAVLKEQMAAKAARDAQIKELYANKVTDDYFKQFGTSHR